MSASTAASVERNTPGRQANVLLAAYGGALPLIWLGRVKPPRSGRGRAYLAVSALGGFAVFPLLFSFGIQLTSAGHGALLLGVLPILTGPIAAILAGVALARA